MAVFTSVRLQDLTPWISSFSLGQVHSIKGISSGIENSNFFVRTDKGEYVLTLFEKLTAEELLNLKVVERAIREPKDPKEGFDKLYLRLKKDLYSALTQGKRLSPQELTERRYQRFRRMGAIEE